MRMSNTNQLNLTIDTTQNQDVQDPLLLYPPPLLRQTNRHRYTTCVQCFRTLEDVLVVERVCISCRNKSKQTKQTDMELE